MTFVAIVNDCKNDIEKDIEVDDFKNDKEESIPGIVVICRHPATNCPI